MVFLSKTKLRERGEGHIYVKMLHFFMAEDTITKFKDK